MAEEFGTRVRRSVKPVAVGFGTLAAAALFMGIGAGTAGADVLKPQPDEPTAGPAVEDGIRVPAVHGEIRAADSGQALAQGEVRGSDFAAPGTKAWVFPGAAGDLSACVYEGPWCANWMAIPFDLNNP